IVLVTVHRRENHGDNIIKITQSIIELMTRYHDMVVVWPVHPNPKVKEAVYEQLRDIAPAIAHRLHITDPLNYPTLLWVLKHAWLTMSDSGGIQEEATALHTPV